MRVALGAAEDAGAVHKLLEDASHRPLASTSISNFNLDLARKKCVLRSDFLEPSELILVFLILIK